MNKKILLLSLLLIAAQSAVAADADGKNSIDLNFTGRILQPSCVIAYNGTKSGNAAEITLGSVNVEEIRYFNANQIGNTGAMVKTISQEGFGIQISGCSASTIATDANGKQFSLTIQKNTGDWVNDSGSQMGGGLTPTTGATDFAARVLVPASFPVGTGSVTSWKTFTASGNAGAADSTNGVAGVTTQVDVALSDLQASGTGDSETWTLPLKVDLGMKSANLDGKNYGAFNVSATITVAYF